MIDNLDKKALIDLTVHFAKDVLPKLATKSNSSVLDKFERKINVNELYGEGKDSLYSFQMKM